MRVVGGSSRGRPIVAPAGVDVRPTSDRVRQAMFTMLDARVGGVEGLEVVDLACGSGALGIEALSRGAASCTFVDSARASLAAAKANVRAVGLGDAKTLFVADDIESWQARQAGRSIDLVIADPPYTWDGWTGLLEALVGVADVLVAEADRDISPTKGWVLMRSLRHGSTVVSVFVPSDQAAM